MRREREILSLFTNDDLSSFSEADGLVGDVDLVAEDVPELVVPKSRIWGLISGGCEDVAALSRNVG